MTMKEKSQGKVEISKQDLIMLRNQGDLTMLFSLKKEMLSAVQRKALFGK